mmetsp:Transcript_32958/g.80140  ORF Transcript_32958/g.80140 Transcript_32958/m.80140 type:complete len:108 (-) Transcript_32958:80-403(-)
MLQGGHTTAHYERVKGETHSKRRSTECTPTVTIFALTSRPSDTRPHSLRLCICYAEAYTEASYRKLNNLNSSYFQWKMHHIFPSVFCPLRLIEWCTNVARMNRKWID